MPHCPICKCDLDDTVSACPFCGSDVLDDLEGIGDAGVGNPAAEGDVTTDGDVDLDTAVLLCKSYSRFNTEFLIETLKSAQIPYYCRIIGGLYGRGMPGTVSIFGSRAADAEIYVPPEYHEDAEEIRRQTLGDE
ncbi:MAG: hypothetical protein KKG33_02875 [candidate division Zixibacteria bacterium]|nr:hypothetical protein [candidate division Zixibacteria bacterium]MBU1470755.1 hypothetical protein [candidate division Zixibacteria bacterium]MBU2624485.1 hypothetical protein [candidate division Zixibacteria bacterium]